MQVLVPDPLQRPEDGLGLQQAVLEAVASDELGPTALLWSSPPYIGATRPETRLPGFEDATRLAGAAGFPVLVRNSGGGAVAANEGSISFSLTFPAKDMRCGLFERYATGVEIVVGALRRLGIAAEGGAVVGEFCPGEYSVRSGGLEGIKHAGLAQRVTRRAARLEALVLVDRTAELIPVLESFYGDLGLPFRSASVGDMRATVPRAQEALVAEVIARYGGDRRPVGENLMQRAVGLRDRWRP